MQKALCKEYFISVSSTLFKLEPAVDRSLDSFFSVLQLYNNLSSQLSIIASLLRYVKKGIKVDCKVVSGWPQPKATNDEANTWGDLVYGVPEA